MMPPQKTTQSPPSVDQSSVPPSIGYRHSVDQDYAISILMELQKSMGKIESVSEGLKTDMGEIKADMSEIKRKVSKSEKILYASGVVLTIAVVIGGWMLNTAKEFAIISYKAALTQQRVR